MRKRLQDLLFSPYLIGTIIVLSLVVRRLSLPLISLDMQAGLFDWYGFILKRGFANAFKENFALYTPAYLYLLWLLTLVDGVVSRVTLIKLISIGFDVISAFFIYKITWLKYPKTRIPLLAAVLAFTLPTVVLNSSYWGQCDSIYTSFLLACLYYLMIERPNWALFYFSLAFVFKLQAIFLLPFLAVYTLRKKIPWLSYLFIPVFYVLFALPTILAGRDWLDVLTIYAHQADKFPKWSSTTPTMYLPLQGVIPLTNPLTLVTIILAAIILSVWIFFSWKKIEKDGPAALLITALGAVAIVPFILPRMHQRYFYPQDLFSLVVAFFCPELWFLPILSQIVSVISYGPFLFNTNFQLHIFGQNWNAILFVALPIEILILFVILRRQFRTSKVESEKISFS